jgi:hypothetical protein
VQSSSGRPLLYSTRERIPDEIEWPAAQ